MEKLKSTESNTVQDKDFYNRTVEKRLLLEMLKDHQHILLTGQRRMGKSSLAREIGRILIASKNSQWKFIFIDLQSCQSSVDIVARLAKELYLHKDFKNSMTDWFSSLFRRTKGVVGNVKVGGISAKIKDYINEGNWKEKGSELFRKIEDSDNRVLLVFDELPDVVTKIEKAKAKAGVEDLLSWLRVEMQAMTSNKKISMLVSGSIGLEPILIRLKLTDLQSAMTPYRLRPWKKATAKNCFIALANYRNIKVDEEIFDYFLEQLGVKYVPQHIQKCWGRLYVYLQEEEKQKVVLADAEYVFNNVILKKESRSMISHYEDRLEETLGVDLYQLAICLLDRMCTGKRLRVTEAINFRDQNHQGQDVQYVLDTLTHDGYLDELEDEWIFNDSLLRKWWVKRRNFRCQ
jgi:energy-coupling factor transporter ATP-binding protein EcfA2